MHSNYIEERDFFVSLLKNFDDQGKAHVELPLQGTLCDRQYGYECAEVTRPYLALIIQGYARYASGPAPVGYLDLEITLAGRRLLEWEQARGCV